jgi:hypothetical protein
MPQLQASKIIEFCDCETCVESDKPCAMDCEADELCDGCREAKDAAEDVRFAIGCAVGCF